MWLVLHTRSPFKILKVFCGSFHIHQEEEEEVEAHVRANGTGIISFYVYVCVHLFSISKALMECCKDDDDCHDDGGGGSGGWKNCAPASQLNTHAR